MHSSWHDSLSGNSLGFLILLWPGSPYSSHVDFKMSSLGNVILIRCFVAFKLLLWSDDRTIYSAIPKSEMLLFGASVGFGVCFVVLFLLVLEIELTSMEWWFT